MPRTCIALFSGGLDSLLALRLMALQGIDVIALHTVNCFHGTQDLEEKKSRLRETAFRLGAKDIVFPDITSEVIEVTRHPRHGYGRHLNACIDCRLRTVRIGFRTLEDRHADFVVSGEVVGQRPMSQRKDAIRLADREIASWGYAGRFLRPLCAKLLDATVPQEEGWVGDECLYDISGRSRERQMALAGELGVTDYPSPAGGCLLTDPGFGGRLAVLMEYTPDWNAGDVELLKVGRHFQVAPGTKLVASRREEENHRLRSLARPDDIFYINAERNGALVMLRGEATPEAEALAAGLAIYYSKTREQGGALVGRWRVDGGDVDKTVFSAAMVDPERVREIERSLTGGGSLRRMRAAGMKA